MVVEDPSPVSGFGSLKECSPEMVAVGGGSCR